MPFKFLGRWGKVKNRQRTAPCGDTPHSADWGGVFVLLRRGNASCLRTIQLQTAGRPNRPAAPYFSVPIRTRQLNQQASVLQQTIANMLIELEQERGGSRWYCSGMSAGCSPGTLNGSTAQHCPSRRHDLRGAIRRLGRLD